MTPDELLEKIDNILNQYKEGACLAEEAVNAIFVSIAQNCDLIPVEESVPFVPEV